MGLTLVISGWWFLGKILWKKPMLSLQGGNHAHVGCQISHQVPRSRLWRCHSRLWGLRCWDNLHGHLPWIDGDILSLLTKPAYTNTLCFERLPSGNWTVCELENGNL
jgi:hypothetical protein